MTKRFNATPAPSRFMARDNEGEGEGGESTSSTETNQSSSQSFSVTKNDEGHLIDNATGERIFLQGDVDGYVVKRNKNANQQLQQAEKTIEGLLKDQNLSSQQRSGYENQLEQLQQASRTEKQQLEFKAQKAKGEYDSALEVSGARGDRYKGLFETQAMRSEFLAMATKHEADNPELFVDLLSPRTEMIADTNEAGEETGPPTPRVRIKRETEDGTVEEVLVSADEAIANMKAQPDKFGGLFKNNRGTGMGGNSESAMGGARINVKEMSKNMEEYKKNRDAIRRQENL